MCKRSIDDWNDFYEDIFKRLDRVMHEKKLYLDCNINRYRACREVATNRTYFSRALSRHHENFRKYVNELRLKDMLSDIHAIKIDVNNIDLNDFAQTYGFPDRKSLDIVLKKERNQTIAKIMKNHE